MSNGKSFKSVSAWGLLVLVLVAASLGSLVEFSSAAEEGHVTEKTPLKKHMNALKDNYRTLRRKARRYRYTKRDVYGEEVVKMLVDMQRHAFAAKQLTPPKVKKASGERKKKLIVSYQKHMIRLLKQLMDAQIAVLEGRNEDATEGINNLAVIKKQSHEIFKPEAQE